MPRPSAEPMDTVETTTNALMALSRIAFSSIEQLAALNLQMARETLGEAVAASELLARPGELPFIGSGETPLGGSAARKLRAYLNDAQGIAADSQDEINHLVTAYFSLNGTLPLPARSWTSGFDLFNQFAQQASRLALANARSVGLNTERLLAVPARQE